MHPVHWAGARRRNPRRTQLRQHLVAWPVGLHHAVAQHQHPVGHRQNARAVRDQEHRAPLGLKPLDGLHQGRLAHIVEVGVGLIQHHQHRVAIHRTRQTDALALATRQQMARLTNGRVIALGQAQNHLVQAGAARCGNHLLGHHLAKPRDVLGNRALKQLDILRQIAQVRAQLIAVPAADRQAIEQHLTRHARPDTHHAARQRGLARARRAQHHRHRARRHRHTHPLEDGLVPPWRHRHHVPQRERALRRHARERRVALGVGGQQCLQPPKGTARANETAPRRHQHVDGRQRPRHQHVGGNHAAG